MSWFNHIERLFQIVIIRTDLYSWLSILFVTNMYLTIINLFFVLTLVMIGGFNAKACDNACI